MCDQPGIPNSKGFDSFCGYLNQRKAHNCLPDYLWRNQERIKFPQHQGHDHEEPNQFDERGRININGVEDPSAAEYSFDVYARASEEFVREDHERPFFLYLAYTIPHMALEVPELGPYTDLDWPSLDHKIWAAMITHIYSALGRLLHLLEELGCDENTLIFFTSDNGYSVEGVADDPTFDEFFRHRGAWKREKGKLQRTHDYLHWELRDKQAVRLQHWYAYRPRPDRPVELYHALEDRKEEETDLAADKPRVIEEVESIMHEAHAPTLCFPAPGKGRTEWEDRRETPG